MINPRRLKPAVHRNWLLLLAGVVWSAVGLMLCRQGAGWLAADRWTLALWLTGLGLLVALPIYRLGFVRIARRNIDRIDGGPTRVCVFSFQPWKSYLIVLLMVALGFGLRHSELPRLALAPLYISIGGALLLASAHYYLRLWRVLRRA